MKQPDNKQAAKDLAKGVLWLIIGMSIVMALIEGSVH